MHPILRDNISALEQGLRLLTSLDNLTYCQCVPACYNTSIGAHFRHILEHYIALLDGLDNSPLDYEARKRDQAIEANLPTAIEATRSITARLQTLEKADLDAGLDVKLEMDSEDAALHPLKTARSTVSRELEFLLSHTTHHFALIGTQCFALRHPIETEFGLAQSTIRHRRRQALAACAR